MVDSSSLPGMIAASTTAKALSTHSRRERLANQGQTFTHRVETSRTAGRVPMDITLVDLPAHEDPDPVSDNFVLCLGMRGTITADFDFGQGWRKAVVPPGTFMPITPPQTSSKLMIDRPHRHLIMSLPMNAVSEIDGNTGDFGNLHAGAFRDALIAQLCIGLWTETKAGSPMGDLYVDCARAALVAALRRRTMQRDIRTATPQILSLPMWRRIQSKINDHLGDRLTVAMLAEAAGLPETSFLRAFKAKTGVTPYRYVLQRRVEAAQAMLGRRELSLVEIALSTGFADQAHMTSAFARHLGQTPGSIRRAAH